MSLEIKSEPGNDVSLNNEILFTVYEATKTADPVTYPDYRYVMDIYVDGTLIQRQKIRPRPDNNIGVFDIAPALRSYVSYGLDISTKKVDYTPYLNYQVKIGEEYSDTLYPNILVDSTDRQAYKSYKVRPFTSSAVLSNGLASNMPSTVNYHRDQEIHLLPYYSNVSGVTDTTQTFYDSSGSSISSDVVSNSDYTANDIRQANILSGLSGPTVPSNAAYALITGNVSLRINYLCESKYTAFTIAWLNPFGAYESQSFGLVSKKTIEIERKDFRRLNYDINASGVISYSANGVFYGGKRGFASTAKIKMLFTSHLLTDAEYQWLGDLFASPDVYLYLSDQQKFIPVTITENSYEFRTYKNSKLTPLQFTVEFADPYNAQYL